MRSSNISSNIMNQIIAQGLISLFAQNGLIWPLRKALNNIYTSWWWRAETVLFFLMTPISDLPVSLHLSLQISQLLPKLIFFFVMLCKSSWRQLNTRTFQLFPFISCKNYTVHLLIYRRWQTDQIFSRFVPRTSALYPKIQVSLLPCHQNNEPIPFLLWSTLLWCRSPYGTALVTSHRVTRSLLNKYCEI